VRLEVAVSARCLRRIFATAHLRLDILGPYLGHQRYRNAAITRAPGVECQRLALEPEVLIARLEDRFLVTGGLTLHLINSLYKYKCIYYFYPFFTELGYHTGEMYESNYPLPHKCELLQDFQRLFMSPLSDSRSYSPS